MEAVLSDFEVWKPFWMRMNRDDCGQQTRREKKFSVETKKRIFFLLLVGRT